MVNKAHLFIPTIGFVFKKESKQNNPGLQRDNAQKTKKQILVLLIKLGQ